MDICQELYCLSAHQYSIHVIRSTIHYSEKFADFHHSIPGEQHFDPHDQIHYASSPHISKPSVHELHEEY